MEAVINITAPIFFLILLGYLGIRLGFIAKEFLPGLSKFVMYFALPALVFTKLLSMDLQALINPDYILIYAAGGLSSFVFTVLLSRMVFRRQWERCGLRGLGAAMPNSAFIGFPILLQFFDHSMVHAFAMAVMVENIILFPVSLIFIETVLGKRSANGQGVLLPVLKRVVSNPIILAVFSGIVCALLGVSFPVFMMRGLDMLAMGSAPAALIVIGGSLVGLSIKGSIGEMSLVAFAKLIFFPMVVAALLLLAPNMPNDLKTAMIILASVPMLSIYPIVGGEYGEQSFCASTLLITTVLSFFTLSVLLRFLV
ncbi:AEC family transporter [Marinomonas sp. M1K-6]|uniref:AEC family transporter n=1 Tax=Marinomonas profundi TaxID=2726122 RepID=A0A847RC26_9GAMM|nr:AEC family transporter [Marinomonas profundi]NLQ17760.1 AEC family transporter [Marinomonas profundi]UDV04317.1 AEC family transporter [Marinomonas profundi]